MSFILRKSRYKDKPEKQIKIKRLLITTEPSLLDNPKRRNLLINQIIILLRKYIGPLILGSLALPSLTVLIQPSQTKLAYLLSLRLFYSFTTTFIIMYFCLNYIVFIPTSQSIYTKKIKKPPKLSSFEIFYPFPARFSERWSSFRGAMKSAFFSSSRAITFRTSRSGLLS